MEALLEGLSSSGERMTARQVLSVASPKKSKASPKRTEAVDTFEGSSDRMETTDLEANPEATEAVVEWQELRKCLVVWHRQWAKKQIQDSVGSWQKLSAAQK
jgi:hypothetical protein